MTSELVRVLILYEDAGAGHRRVAEIVAEALESNPAVTVIQGTGTDLLGVGGARAVAALWNWLIAADQRRLADGIVNFGFRVVGLPMLEHFDGPKAMARLQALRPDVIVCTADGYAKVIGAFCAQGPVRHVQVVTDFAIFLDLVHPDAEHIVFFNETTHAVQQLDLDHVYFQPNVPMWRQVWSYAFRPRRLFRQILERGPTRNSLRCTAIGPLVDRRFSKLKDPSRLEGCGDKPAATHSVSEDPKPMPRIAVVGGSIGGRFVTRTCRALAQPGSFAIDAYCGRDTAAANRLRRLALPGVAVHEFVPDLPQRMAASAAVIARPSAGIVSEALVLRVPLIMPRRTTANDSGSVRFVEHHGLGAIYDRPGDLLNVVQHTLTEAAAIRSRQQALCRGYAVTRDAQLKRIQQIVLGGP